ncbi:MAG: hypothetical protein U0228_10985 [Myxococcaceae bacterium]
MRWWLLVAVVSLAGSTALGEESPHVPPTRTEKLARLKRQARTEAQHIALWKWGWVGAYTAITLAQVVPLPFLKDRDLAIDFAVGAVSGGVGVLGLALLPMAITRDVEEIEAQPDTDEGLARAEELLRRDAEDEQFNVSLVAHVSNVLTNVIVGLVMGLGWQHWDSAVVSIGIGLVLGEVTLFTQPTALTPRVQLAPWVAPSGGGVRFGFSF